MDGRDVAQFGSALDWGSRGRRFKSGRPDEFIERLYPEIGNETGDNHSHLTGGMSKAFKMAAVQS
jgi:hypothetical protein